MSEFSPNGVTINHDLTGIAAGKVTLMYRGPWTEPGMSHLEITCEVYQVDGEVMVHTVCPKCRHALKISSKNKAIEYDKARGTLKVERFKCPWEMDDDRKEFGMSLCNLEMAYEGKVAREV